MSADENTPTQMHEAPAADIEDVRVEDEMEQSYIDYSMSVIAGRALPDARDGLKPVQRRILYAMETEGLSSGGSHRKSSSVVGKTMGNYHPHGDSAIYDTLVRMGQEFSLRYPLIDGQGNFGSIDGDPPAAERYTEARLTPLSEELLESIDQDTVDWQPNYDDRLEEPEVLPASFPNLLVNGASGIAVGMSTDIPPHNLGEIIDATIHRINNPNCDTEALMDHVKGPDFPTGATIVGREPIKEAYETGRGRLRVRAQYEIVRNDSGGDQIVITEIPFQTDKSKLVEKIADLVKEGTLDGISDMRDESDRNGIRVVLDLKRDAITDVVENNLIDTVLEKTFGVRNLALVDGQPKLLSLGETLDQFIDHRREVVRRRSENELEEKEDRAHILEGRLKALDKVEDVVDLIRDADDRDAARDGLESEFDFSEDQAAHIVRMQLGSLTSMEEEEIQTEYEDVTNRIERLEAILSDDDELMQVIKDELREIKEEYADERRTNIIEDTGSVTSEDLIPEENIYVVLTEEGYVKRMPVDVVDRQSRGGKGVIGADLKPSDNIHRIERVNTHDRMLLFTTQGQAYPLKGYELPEVSRTARGTSIVNVLDLDEGEEVIALATVDDLDSFADDYDTYADADAFLTFATENGYVKRTPIAEFSNIYTSGIRAIRLGDDDALVDVTVTDGTSDLLLTTKHGRAIRFDETDVSASGRNTQGVGGVRLADDADAVQSIVLPDDGSHLLTLCEQGYGKRTPFEEYRVQSRYGKGLMDIKTEGRNGPTLVSHAVHEDDELALMSKTGQLMRIAASEISSVGRNTKGVKVMTLEGDDELADVALLPAESRNEDS